jgi:hypothetical protein
MGSLYVREGRRSGDDGFYLLARSNSGGRGYRQQSVGRPMHTSVMMHGLNCGSSSNLAGLL